jgi:AAA family ATP:ADP antiporter
MARTMSTQSGDAPPPNSLSRLFGLEKHEYVAVGWSFVYFFCVLSSYYVLRPIREEMAVFSGANTIPWLFMGTFVAMLIATPIFGWVASRFPRRRFLPWVYLFFICNILIFWVVFSIAIDREQNHVWLGRIFFVWLSIFNLFVVSVFWSFMADIYSREQGRRLFGVITAGGSIGALLGGVATSALVVTIGFQNLFPIAAVLLAAAILCIRRLRNWVSAENEAKGTAPKGKPLGGSPFAGITHLTSSPYFAGIAVSSVIASLLGTALYMFTASLLEQSALSPNERTQFFSNINNVTNLIALLGQMFVVRHVVSRFGIGVSLALMPIVSIAGFAILAINPTLVAVAILTIARRGIGFGLTKPTTDMLYSVVTPEEKYKTKNFIDTAIYRGGDLIGTWSVRGLMSGLGMSLSAVSWLMVPFTALWAIIAIWLGRDYKRRAKLGIGTPAP